ncbi:MAG TPA: hypothetical protein VI306_17740 [Pyrinomonadaceae bacterium]
MVQVNIEAQLEALSDVLLFQNNKDDLNKAVHQLYELFLQIAGDLSSTETLLPEGLAISPEDAARCVLDVTRTTQFLRGVYAALQRALTLFPNRQLEVVYAGCGPFAPLIVPLIKRFEPSQLSLTLVDIHQESLHSVAGIFKLIGAEQYVKSYRQADATTYQHDVKIHLLIIETMQRALTAEPQVAVTLNLAKQLSERGILIPEEITVELVCVDLAKDFTDLPKTRVKLGNVLQLSRLSSFTVDSANTFIARVIDTTAMKPGLTFTLFTKLRIFEEIILDHYESGITFPHPLHDLTPLTTSNQLELTYQLGASPGFKYRWR